MPGDDLLGAAFDVAAFMATTGCEDEATASFFLESAAGNADLALELYYDDADDEAENEAAIAALAIPPPVSVRSSFGSRKKQKKDTNNTGPIIKICAIKKNIGSEKLRFKFCKFILSEVCESVTHPLLIFQ